MSSCEPSGIWEAWACVPKVGRRWPWRWPSRPASLQVTQSGPRPSASSLSAQVEFDILASPAAGGAAIRGGVLRVGGYLVGVLLTVVSAAVLFRYLGPDDAGKYVTVLAIVAIVGSMFDGGLHSLAIRETSVRRGDDRRAVISDLLGMRLVLGVAGIGLAAAFATAAGYEHRSSWVRLWEASGSCSGAST